MAETTEFWFAGSTEEFRPAELVAQARAAEAAGFDGLALSDHWGPWFPDGEGTQAWVTLGAIGALTSKPLGTGVTAISHRYHPAIVAQAFMSLEALCPGRAFLGVGSGEAVNETPTGLDWPDVDEQLERFERGLEAIVRLWNGETVTMDGGWFELREARLFTRAESRPRLYASAFGPKAARIRRPLGRRAMDARRPRAGAQGDRGLSRGVRRARPRAGRDHRRTAASPGPSPTKRALRGARRWKPTQLPELYTDDIHNQDEMQRLADEKLSDEEFAESGFLISSDPDEHVRRIGEMRELGATVICLQLIGQADPMGSIGVDGEFVLPALREQAASVGWDRLWRLLDLVVNLTYLLGWRPWKLPPRPPRPRPPPTEARPGEVPAHTTRSSSAVATTA